MAIGLSVAAHGVVLGLLAGAQRKPSTSPEPQAFVVVGTVRTEIVPGAKATTTTEVAPPSAAEKKAPAHKRPAPARIAPLPGDRGPAAAAVAPGGPPRVAGKGGGRGAEFATGTTGGGESLTGGAVDPDSVRRAIASAIQYPRLARRRRITGRVTVRFFVDESGAPTRLRVLASAHPLLESAARRAVDRASPYASGIGWIRVPIDFSLEQKKNSDLSHF